MLSYFFELIFTLLELILQKLLIKRQLANYFTLYLLGYFAVLFQHGDDLTLLALIL
jgi:hypothetical protein